MTSNRTFFMALLTGVVLAGCGNYSNDDLDFQLALPDESDIAAQMRLSVSRVDSSEYYRATRSAITTFNAMVGQLAGLIDLVRGYSPTSRNGAERVWGPWPVKKNPAWELRLVMQRSTVSPTILHMDYWLELRPVGGGDLGWVSFLIGKYESAGSARTGQGEIHLLTADARAVGYPVNADAGLVDLDHLDVYYDNASFPVTVTMQIVNLPTATTKSGLYDYLQNQDGSGRMSFDWQGLTDTGIQIAARMLSQWKDSGAGRADLTADLTPSQPSSTTTLGIDCWGGDSVATYTFRLRDDVTRFDDVSTGDPSTCLLF